MKLFIKVTLIIFTTLVSFTACRDNDDDITPSGNYSPIRGGFPQGNSELDSVIFNIKQEYDIYLLYKDVTEEDMNRTWVSAGTGDIYVAGDPTERENGTWDLPEEHLPYYINFFSYYIFPNITKEFAKTTFPIKIYMINNLRTEPRIFGVDDEEEEESKEENKEEDSNIQGTDANPNKIIKLGDFDNWAISIPDSVIQNTSNEGSEYALKQLHCVFMINVIDNSIEKGTLVSPDAFWKDYDMSDSALVNVKDMNASNSLRNLGYIDILEEKFGTGRSNDIIKPLPVTAETKPLQHTSNWGKGKKGWDLFRGYIMNAMWFTPEEFHARYETDKYTKIKEKYDFVVNYIWEEYGIDLVGIANGKEE